MKIVTEWEVPQGDGAPILTMPNVPKPLHSLAPRTIMGATAWKEAREACYEACNRHCEVCGAECGPGKMDAHELYDYDFEKCEARFNRLVGLCKSCHGIIHSGRMLTMFHNHNFYYTKDYLLTSLERSFELVQKWNKLHEDAEPLRVWATILAWADEPSLGDEVRQLIDDYGIHFYTAENAMGENGTWNKWKLIYDGTEYYSPYEDMAAWADEMAKKNGEDNTSLFVGDEFEELRKNIQSMK